MDGDESAPRGPRSTVETTGVAVTPRAASALEIGSARTVLAHPLPGAATEHRLVEGEAIGRFVITRLLGRGGMGEVYAAHDPELGRSVAIKLLRPELSTTHADLRLHREARAMARLSHPNLVTVHDVGVHDGQLFVAMELIAGGTLRTWARGRRWREIVAAYVAAGRGLASAHEAGVVHRDFKPDNVLVGDDGRVAVGDFGLAMTSPDDLPPEPSGGATFLTQAGTLLGTVRYMAPEQLAGRIADARSDQFAFCLSLWEALDEDPFGPLSTDGDVATTAQTRRAAIDEGPRRRKLAGVPARISRALVRGFARDPAERWPAMTDLLDHLAPTRRRGLIAGAAVGLAAIGLAIAATWMLRTPAADPCDGAAAAMQAVWKPGSVQRLRSAFAPLHLPNGDDAASRTAAILDRRAAAWSIMRVDSCRATARGAQTAELDRRRTRCLDARLAETSGLVDALAIHPTADIVGRAIRAADALTAIESCGKVDALLQRPAEPASAATRAQIAALDAEIARADAREKLGDPAIVPKLADLQRRAIALDWPPAIAAIDLTIGHEAWRREDPAAAETALRAAALAAARAKDDDLGARALALLSEALVDADRPSDAVEVARAAELLATRAGNPPELEAEVLESLAIGDVGLSRFDEADRAYARAVDLLSHSRPGSVQLASALNNWSDQLFQRSDYARALPLSDRALALLRAQLGEHDPDYARALHNNGNLLVAAGRYPEAKARFEAALAIKQQLYGPDASTVAQTLHSLGNVAHETGDYARAAQLYTRAHEIWQRTLGPDHSLTLMARYSLGLNLKDQHRPEEAIAVLDDVLARRSAAKDPQPAKIATTLDALAGCYTERGDLRKALALEQRALAIREKVLGPTTGDVADSLATIAELQGTLGDCTDATTAARRAIEILHGLPGGDALAGTPTLALAGCARGGDAIRLYRQAIELLAATPDAAHDRGRARLALATLLWPSDRAAARELATAAAQDLAHDPDLARATAWLDAHRL